MNEESDATTHSADYQRVVRALATLLDETGLTEIEVEQGGLRVRVARQHAAQPAHPAATVPLTAAASLPAGVASILAWLAPGSATSDSARNG